MTCKGNRKKASDKTDNIQNGEKAEGTVKKRRKRSSSADVEAGEGLPSAKTPQKTRRKKAETAEDPDKIIIRSDELKAKKKASKK